MSEREQRQYRLVRDVLNKYQQRRLALPELISALRSLEDEMLEATAEWKRAFKGEWWTLEQIYAAALDRGEEGVSPEGELSIAAAIDELQRLTLEVLDASADDEI